jgi:AmiR/NasT family two-component response regulator
VNVNLVPEQDRPDDGGALVQTAVGVLMELRGWDASRAGARLALAAVRAKAPVESLAQAILSLYP